MDRNIFKYRIVGVVVTKKKKEKEDLWIERIEQ